MRRRRAMFRRKPPTQWIADGETFTTVGTNVPVGGAVTTTKLCGGQGGTSDPPGIQRFTILRIRGQLCFAPLAGTGWLGNDTAMLSYGIGVTTTTGAGVATAWNPASSLDADKAWMYLGHWQVVSDTGANFHDFFQIEIDIKTRRVIRGDQRCCLFVTANNIIGVGTTVSQRCFLRTLISRVA